MTRIFISHSHADEAIAHKLFDFLIAALKLNDEDILCTSDPNSGLSFNSNSISDQLKKNLKIADALVALITTDSLRSPWIPFEIGSFWPTEKTIVLILGPGLKPDQLPGPLKGWLSICIGNNQAFEQLNQVINQLEIKLEIRQNVHRSRRDRYLKEFITRFKAWEPKLFATDESSQEKVTELEKKLQDQEETHKMQLWQLRKELENKSQEFEQSQSRETTIQEEKNNLEKSLKDTIVQIKKELEKVRSQADKRIQELESEHQAQITKIKEDQKLHNQILSFPTEDFIEDLRNGIKLEMVAIPGGKFLMGSPEGEGNDNEKPQHEVTVQSFFIGKYPITQGQYRQLMGTNPSHFKDSENADQKPVECVSWENAEEFCKRISKLTGKEYRLPSEAEWEYACRADTSATCYFEEKITDKLVNYAQTFGETTQVGKYPPNTFGLYDMLGNVWEMCQDNWHDNYQEAPTDGRAWFSEKSQQLVLRGGSWIDNHNVCRSASRTDGYSGGGDLDFGFRVVCSVPRTL